MEKRPRCKREHFLSTNWIAVGMGKRRLPDVMGFLAVPQTELGKSGRAGGLDGRMMNWTADMLKLRVRQGHWAEMIRS